ncbi:MAG: AAA family ATPase, partial [Fibrobacter sp.]|nr:AAA family ATPase [Fibrobacter sp.]
MKKIGFKNFRKFENFPTIELGDVTYLVGQNNAGKSTMVKAAILMLENLRQKSTIPLCDEAFFSFVSPVHDLHVETFARALHRSSEEKRIQFNATIGDFDFEIVVVPADDEGKALFGQKDNDRVAPIDYFSVNDNELGVKLEIHPLLRKYVLTISGSANEVDQQEAEALFEEITQRISRLRKPARPHHYSTSGYSGGFIGCLTTASNDDDSEYKILTEKLAKLENSKKAPKEEQLVFNALYLTYVEGNEAMFPVLREVEALAYMASYGDARKQSELSSLSLGLNDSERRQQSLSLAKLPNHSDVLSKMASRLKDALNSIEMMYIPAHLASQDLVLNAHTKDIFANEIDKYVHQTQRFDNDKTIYRYLQKWMDAEHFNIGKGFTVEERLPGYYILTVDTYDNGPIPVGDMGMGTNQLMILLLNIANKMHDARRRTDQMRNERLFAKDAEQGSCPIIFIEEPEQNLHPNLQSKLAD